MLMSDATAGDSDRDATKVIHAAIDAGVTLIDTADAYDTELLVGRAVRARRDEVLLCSKFGLVWGQNGDWSIRADPAYVRRACEASLRRLRVETIDLYYLHHRSDTTPIEETVGAMAELVQDGKVRFLGLSNVIEDDLRRADAVHPIAALQEQWSLAHRDVEQMVPAIAEVGAAVVAYSPTAHGALHAPGLDAARSSALVEIAEAHEATVGQVSLAWVHSRRQRWDVPVVPLPGTTSLAHLRENVAAADLSLSGTELDRLEGEDLS